MTARIRRSVATVLKKIGANPFAELVELARNRETPLAIQAKIWMELATYCQPKLRSVEVIEREVRGPANDTIQRAKQLVFGLGNDDRPIP